MVFCFVQKLFFGQHKNQNIYSFCREKREFFFQNLTLGYMSKTLNQNIFFSSTKIRIFCSATLGVRIFFQKKTITPSLFKLNGRSLTGGKNNYQYMPICLILTYLLLSILFKLNYNYMKFDKCVATQILDDVNMVVHQQPAFSAKCVAILCLFVCLPLCL